MYKRQGTGGSVAIKGGDYTGEFDSALMDAYYDTSISAGTFTSPDAADYAVQSAVAASLNSTGKTYIGTAEMCIRDRLQTAAPGLYSKSPGCLL